MNLATTRARLLASTIITGVSFAGLGVTHAVAADAAAAAAADTSVGELVVTGSRIPSKNLTSVSPVTTVDNRDIKLQGTTNVEDFLNNLPQVFATQGQYLSNGSTGTATVDLRGLGTTRTLVLIDGKRVQPGDPATPVADINFIPPALIDRVDVLTGGASAVYGSDAVSGVVNFIMKKNFQGLQIDAQTSIAMHENDNKQVRAANALGQSSFGFPDVKLPTGTTWAGQRHTVTIIGGVNTPDDKGNVEFYAGYSSIDKVIEGQYDYSTCSLSTNNSNNSQQYCGGSSTDRTGRITPSFGPYAGKSYNVLGAVQPDGRIAKFSAGQDYNFAPLNYIQRPDTRYSAGYYATYKVNKAVEVYSSFMFMDDTSVAQIGPSGSFYGQLYTVPCNDPLLSMAQATSLCGAAPAGGYPANGNLPAFTAVKRFTAPNGTVYNKGDMVPAGIVPDTATIGRRNVEGGGRTDGIQHTAYRLVFGTRGDIGDGWTYDISGQYGKTTVNHQEGGYFLNSKLANALNVVSVNGVPTCQSVVAGTDKNCVPYNIFTAGGVTPAALGYLTGASQYGGYTTQQVVTGSLSNDLGRYGLKSPFATDGVGVSFGGEYRREFLQTFYDSVQQSGDLAGSGGSTKNTKGAQVDKDVFAEVRVPLIQDVPFIKDLTLEGGYRYADYSSGGGNSTYKVGLDWQVVPDLRVRGSYERAVRAPNVQELFNPATPGLVAGTDPCAGAKPTYTAAQCYNTLKGTPGTANITEEVFASQIYGNITPCVSAQCGNFGGGNPNLTPESADTYSVGVVFTPTFFRPFTLSIDYFNITVNKVITTLSFNSILQSCALNDNAVSCGLINRNANVGYALFGDGNAGFVVQQNVNANSLKTRGVDVNANYRLPLPALGKMELGNLGFHFEGTYVDTLTTTVPTGAYDCAGLFGTTCGTPTPKWRSQLRVTWTTPWNVGASLNWRYLGPTKLDINTSNPLLNGAGPDTLPTDSRIGAYSYFDLAFTWKIKDRYTFRGGVNNIFDRTPPLLDSNSYSIAAPSFGNANTFPQVYDPLGREFFIGVTADF